MTNHVLLTVSGSIPADIAARTAAGHRPRADYLELARGLGADLLDSRRARTTAGWLAPLLERVGGINLLIAFACFLLRGRYKVMLTDGEQIGLPLALLLKYVPGPRPRHLMIVHTLSVPKKTFFLDRLGVQTHIDRFLCYATSQKQFIERRWGIPAHRVPFTPFMVDQHFFAPKKAQPAAQGRPMICAVGLERRDYPTLLKAVDGLDVAVIIAAGSLWSKRSDITHGQPTPPNVSVRTFSQFELRQVYADSRFLVMPLENVDFQAGITAILEAMAMERAVICSQTPGQTDVIIEGENGLYVPPADPSALRAAIVNLVANPERAASLGKAGRQLVEGEMNLDRYVERIGALVREAMAATNDLPQHQVSTARS